MAKMSMGPLLRHLRKVSDSPHGPGATDAELLERFVHRRDEVAFELLMWRLPRMVLGVCRRVLRDPHDAEDAFQAAFLVLVRKAGSLGRVGAVAGWLHRVTYHIALRARKGAARRARTEIDFGAVGSLQGRVEYVGRRDLATVLDGEVNHLPEHYRLPIVLCYLEGKTYQEAAQQLGVPVGTLSARLTRARSLLRARLTRRGIALSGALLATLLAERAAEASSASALVNNTLKAAVALATGRTTAEAASPAVAALTEGALRTMFRAKLKVVTTVLLSASLLAGLLV